MILFLIGTEHQLFQVLDVIEFLKCDQKDCILLFENNENETRFINELYNKYSFKKVIVFQSWIFKDLFFNRSKVFSFLKICKEIKNIENIYFYHSHYDTDSTLLFSKIVKPIKSYLLDEGTASFSVVHYRKKFQHFNLKLLVKSLLYRRLLFLPKRIIYFTKFHLSTNIYDSVLLYSLQKNKNQRLPIENDKLFILGSSISDIGYMKEDIYIKLINSIKIKFNKEIHYFSHRKENASKLQKIESLGILIHTNEMPFENYFLQLTKWPEYISSFYFSNILDSIKSRYSEVPNCILFKFDKDYILKEQDVYEDIFKHNCANNDFKIVYLDI